MGLKSALVLFLALAGAAPAMVPETAVVWRSRANNDAALAIEIEQLFLTLYNSGNLTLREEVIGTPAFVEVLLRNQGVMHGAYFPESLDAMMCDINPGLCRRTRTPVSDRQLSNPVGHVGGFAPSRGNWRLSAGDRVKIPDYSFRPVTTLVRIPAPEGWSVTSYVPEPGLDCSAWKMSCEEVVATFNPRLLKSLSAGTTITIPRQQYETNLWLQPDESSELLSSLMKLREEQDAPSAETVAPKTTEKTFAPASNFSPSWNSNLLKQSPADLTLQGVRNNLRPLGSVDLKWAGDEPLMEEQIDLFEVIHHPFAKREDLGPSFQRPVDIVVIDAPLSMGHCDLPDLLTPEGEVLPRAEMGAEETCDQLNPAALSDADHAAAVAGVIAAPANQRGTLGINPHARLWMLGLDQNVPADQGIFALIQQLLIGIPKDARVANLSFGMQPEFTGREEVRAALAIHGSRMLIVAAAGNENRDMTKENCPILPACLNDLDNVITVVGLDGQNVWSSQTAGSNRNPRFDIGAPAVNILTTVTGNRFAVQKGTSFAAPQVSAVASLIFASGEFIYGDELGEGGGQLSPKIVKDRLSYTADFFPQLAGALRDGRLNVSRAIHLHEAQFELFDGRTITGQVIEAPAGFVCKSPHEDQGYQNWYNVRRLGWNDAKKRHFIFKHTGGELGGRYGPLERDPSCLVRTLSAKITVLTRDAEDRPEEVTFAFRDIRDYTSPLFDE